MKSFYDTIRELVDWTADPDALVMSVYLDVSEDNDREAVEFAREECALRVEQDGGDARQRAFGDAVRSLLAALPALVAKARAEDYGGLAAFVCADPSLREVVRLRFPFRNQVQVGRDPFLKQLLFYAEEYEQAVCAVVRESGVEVCEVHVGDLGRTRRLQPTHGRTLGEELNTLLVKLTNDDPRLHVILAGAEGPRARVERDLGATVLARVIDRIDLDLAPGDPRFLQHVHRSLQAYERRMELRGVEELLERHGGDGLAALGERETLEAINHARIQKLYVLQNYAGAGWLCDACDYLGCLPAPPACVVCGASVSEVPLEEHVLDQAAACGAEVETVLESAELTRLGGIGALLHGSLVPAG